MNNDDLRDLFLDLNLSQELRNYDAAPTVSSGPMPTQNGVAPTGYPAGCGASANPTYGEPVNPAYAASTDAAPARQPASNDKRAVASEKSSKRTAFQVMESYKMIRTNLLFALATTSSRVVVFSSAEPSAGKSTLSANLAIVMAQTGARVLLLDADMRKPSQHRNFRKTRSLGLSKVLGGLCTLDECIHRNVKPNVDLITSGPTPPNPSELLGSVRMKEVLDELQNRYDYIFVDMPPLCIVADALVVAPNAAGVVLVARHNQTMYEEFAEALEKVETTGAKMLGVVLTDMKVATGNYGRYGRYGRYSRYDRRRYYQRYDYEYGSK